MTTEATEAPALAVLRRLLDERWPRRSRVADRVLGRDRDHAGGNAIDVSYDPVSGPDLEPLAAALLRDPRTAVVMWRGRIAEPAVDNGAWRAFAGSAEGSHAGHLHLSIDPRQRASEAPWHLESAEGEAGDVFWPLDSDRARAVRAEQREYLRDTWVRDTPLGKFLRLDEPDGPVPAAPPAVKPSPGWENYGHRSRIELLDTDTGGRLAQAGKEAARGASIGGTVGTALEAVPVVGPILHAASAVVGAIAGFFAGLGRDPFHPDPMTSAAWLALFSLNPAMIFSGIDKIDVEKGEAVAARLVRYFLLVSGTVPAAGKLYNPRSDRKDNAYMQKVDPRFPQTDPRHLKLIKRAVMYRLATAPEVTTPEAARGLLGLIRKVVAKSGVMQSDEAKAHLRSLRRNLRHVRALAGETGRDVNLEVLFRGSVRPKLARYPALPTYGLATHLKRLNKKLSERWAKPKTGDTGAPAGPVIVYGASWCGPCHSAVDYLRARGVPYALKDIERTIGARTEMDAKLARAGLQPRAIPVLDVAGRVMVGFRPSEVDEALGGAGFSGTPSVAPRARMHEVTRSDVAVANLMGTYAAAERMARDWGVLDRNWFSELMGANPEKARDQYGYWKALGEGERICIPAAWPEPTVAPSAGWSAGETGRIDDWDSFQTPGFAE